jgi:hypothetical protein
MTDMTEGTVAAYLEPSCDCEPAVIWWPIIRCKTCDRPYWGAGKIQLAAFTTGGYDE